MVLMDEQAPSCCVPLLLPALAAAPSSRCCSLLRSWPGVMCCFVDDGGAVHKTLAVLGKWDEVAVGVKG